MEIRTSLFGKHPSSSEYLYFGDRSDFMNAVAQWVEKGYETLLQNRINQHPEKIDHFSFFKPQERRIICGSMKLSSDKRNRKYPLVIAVEVTNYTTLLTTDEMVSFSKELGHKMCDILKKECGLESLKEELTQLAAYRPHQENVQEVPSSIIMNEDFSEIKLFYRPLELNDFIETVR